MKSFTHQKKWHHCLPSPLKHCRPGKLVVKSKLSGPKVDIDGMSTLPPCKFNKTKNPRKNTFMQESHLVNKLETYKDRLLRSKKPIPPLKLSKTLDQDSISRERVSSPFWTKSLEETYKKLWLPTETDLQDLDTKCFYSCSTDLECPSKSYQMKTSKSLLQSWPRTSFQSLRFSQPDTTDQDPIQFCRKIRFYPNNEQKKLLNQCLGASRYFFNKAVKYLNDHYEKEGNLKGMLKLATIRPLVMKSDKDIPDDDSMAWQKMVPYDTRQEAISDALSAFKSCLTNLRNGNIKHFKVNFRSKKRMQTYAFRANKKTLNPETMSFFPDRLKENKYIRMRKRDIAKFKEDGTLDGNFIILRSRPDYWYLCLPRSREQPVFSHPVYKSVFLDPGVRTFQTFYSPDGVCGKIESDKGLLQLAKKHDHLWSVSDQSQTTVKTKKGLRKRCAMIRRKIKNKVNDLHWQTCSFLCNTFQNIFLPEFKVSEMVKGSPLGSEIARRMLQLSHSKFRERLLYYGKTKNRNVYIVSEEYTTKTCGCCGNIQAMEGNKVYNCESCCSKLDRDYNGARNICLKVVTQLLT